MDYVKPADVAVAMIETGKRKLALAPSDLLIRGMLSGALLGVSTSLAFTAASKTLRFFRCPGLSCVSEPSRRRCCCTSILIPVPTPWPTRPRRLKRF